MSVSILLRTINLGGVIYHRGADLTDVATPGELESLRASGVLSAEEFDEPEDDEPDDEEPDDEEPEDDEPDDEEPGGEEADELNEGDPPMFGLPAKVIELLAAHTPPILTEDDVMNYAAEHNDNFSKIAGIGRSTSRTIVSAVKATLE